MSIVQNSDVLNQNSMATDKASYVQQIQRGRDVHSLTQESRQKMCDDIRDLKKASQRTDYMLSLDHCLYEKSKFIQEYTMNFTPGTNSEGINGNYCTCDLHFNTITGFNNMKNFYDAFIVNKITATFYSTEGTNITPFSVPLHSTSFVALSMTETYTFSIDGGMMYLQTIGVMFVPSVL